MVGNRHGEFWPGHVFCSTFSPNLSREWAWISNITLAIAGPLSMRNFVELINGGTKTWNNPKDRDFCLLLLWLVHYINRMSSKGHPMSKWDWSLTCPDQGSGEAAFFDDLHKWSDGHHQKLIWWFVRVSRILLLSFTYFYRLEVACIWSCLGFMNDFSTSFPRGREGLGGPKSRWTAAALHPLMVQGDLVSALARSHCPIGPSFPFEIPIGTIKKKSNRSADISSSKSHEHWWNSHGNAFNMSWFQMACSLAVSPVAKSSSWSMAFVWDALVATVETYPNGPQRNSKSWDVSATKFGI